MKLKRQKGFTLIELLIVISIIGFLASIVLVSLNNARIKAREAQRKENLTQISKALELYYNDNGSYPSTGRAWWAESSSYGSHTRSGANGYVPGLAPTYIAQLPRDPLTGTDNTKFTSLCTSPHTYYFYVSDGLNYKVNAGCLVETVQTAGDPFIDPVRPNISWTIYTAGAINW